VGDRRAARCSKGKPFAVSRGRVRKGRDSEGRNHVTVLAQSRLAQEIASFRRRQSNAKRPAI